MSMMNGFGGMGDFGLGDGWFGEQDAVVKQETTENLNEIERQSTDLRVGFWSTNRTKAVQSKKQFYDELLSQSENMIRGFECNVVIFGSVTTKT